MRRAIPAVLALLAACGSGSGADSPEDCIARMNRAHEVKDHVAFLDLVLPSKRATFTYTLLLVGKFTGMTEKDEAKRVELEKAMAAICARHGVDTAVPEPKAMSDARVVQQAADAALKNAKVPALYADLIAHLEKHAKGSPGPKGGKLSDLKVEGDKASGTLTDSAGRSGPVTFARLEGRWYLAME